MTINQLISNLVTRDCGLRQRLKLAAWSQQSIFDCWLLTIMEDAIIYSAFGKSESFIQNIQAAVVIPSVNINNAGACALPIADATNSIVGVSISYSGYNAGVVNSTTITDDEYDKVHVKIGALHALVGGDTNTLLFYVSNDCEVYDLLTHTFIGQGTYLVCGSMYATLYTKNLLWKAMKITA